MAEVPALTLVAGRMLLATLIMFGILRLRRVALRRDRRLWGTFAVPGLLNAALPYGLISWGEQYIPSGLVAPLQATTPVFNPGPVSDQR